MRTKRGKVFIHQPISSPFSSHSTLTVCRGVNDELRQPRADPQGEGEGEGCAREALRGGQEAAGPDAPAEAEAELCPWRAGAGVPSLAG